MGDVIISNDASIHWSAVINVSEYLYIGEGAIIGEGCVIEGRDVRIGNELYMGAGAKIGGGSRWERQSKLRVGHFLHMGEGSFINTARPVTIGDEVGLGMGTKVFTHGAYLNALDGFPVAFAPVSIGDRVWLPGAIVNPGVTIGSDVVVGVNSLVTRDLPDGCLAAGSPAKVIKEDVYPQELTEDQLPAFWDAFKNDYPYPDDDLTYFPTISAIAVNDGETTFHMRFPRHRTIIGKVSDASERLRNQLRRYGIRFYCRPTAVEYREWK